MVENMQIFDTIAKMGQVLKENKKIAVSISGGSDSDVLVHLFTSHNYITPDHEIRFIMFDTGLEFTYTKEHIKYLEKRYNIEIEILKAVKPIPVAIRENGVPLMGKTTDYHIYMLQKNGFDFQVDGKLPYEKALYLKKLWRPVKKNGKVIAYKNKCYGALRYFYQQYPNVNMNNYTRQYLIENGLDIKVSASCCQYAKKDVAKKFQKENNFDCWVVGIRHAEGGSRLKIKDCYRTDTQNRTYYHPLLHWSDKDKEDFNKYYNIQNSKCYTEMGMKRTGCAGCPYVRDFDSVRELVKEHDPKLSKAIEKIFGEAYEVKREIMKYKRKGSSDNDRI